MRLLIESLAYGGAGVASADDGRVVFVEGACPGDTVEAQAIEEHPRFLKARIETILEASPDRVQPPCPYFGQCGGCQWQHISYETQLTAKRRAIEDALLRIGKIESAEVAAVAASPDQYGYRNKIELSVALTPKGPSLGFARHGSGEIVSIDECMLLPKAARRAPRSLSGALRYLGSRTETAPERVSIRVARDGGIEVDIWTAPGPYPRSLAAKVITDAVGAKTVTRVIAKGEKEARRISNVEVLSGPGSWRERLGAYRYIVSAPSFFQVNTRAAEILQSITIAAASVDETSTVADLYAGVGTFTLPLAAIAGEVIAVESSAHALSDLRRNLDEARLDAEVIPGDAARELAGLEGIDTVVIDPPRAGLSQEAGRALIEARPARIVYVSCDPATLARDAKILRESGYSITGVSPVDLFPQTYHVESVTTLIREDVL
ncbi:MAG: 23S rRNA (uracil-5-)-methyltransferase [Actinobacteria bacterium]|nr:MAG: 23S rRNA (uracil-5-)-methyltransferase [Actinomycetota bacterium]